MKKRRTKRFEALRYAFIIVLCLAVCLTTFSTVAFAKGETIVSVSAEEQLLNAITDAGSDPTIIDVTENISFIGLGFMGTAIDIPSGADITIRASGKDITLSRFAKDVAIFDVKSGGKLTLSSDGDNTLTIDGDHIISTVSSIVVSGALVTNDVNFQNHTLISGKGAAISCSGASASCTVNGGTFKNNIGGANGGAIATDNSALKIDGATFENNTIEDTVGSGGAIYCKTSSIDFKNATFTNNSAMVGGAVEFTTECTGTIENCTFKSNKADGIMGKGGALDFDECVAVRILSGTFEENYASTWGGAIYTDGIRSDFFMNTVLFENNNASLNGGAIWHCPLGTAHYYTYSGMMFWNNSATSAGADMYLAKAKVGRENGGEYVSDKTYAGSGFDWCYDKQTARYNDENPDHITDISYYQGSNEEIAMKSNITESDYLSAKDAAVIVFKGNSSAEGGAIANNGFIEVGYKSGLTIEKRVTGENAPTDDVFSFTVSFSDAGTYDGIESGSTVTIKAGEKKLVSDIPEGIVATVTELPKTNYTPVQASQEATIGEYGSEIIFVNHYEKIDTITLSVQKIWQDNNSAGRPSSVSVQLYKDGNAIDSPVTLNADNDWKTEWTELESGSNWTVDEVNTPAGYTKTVSNTDNSWTITNKLNTGASGDPDSPETGDNCNLSLWIAILLISFGMITILSVARKSRKSR